MQKIFIILLITFLSACETTRKTSTQNVGAGKTTGVVSGNFDKKEAAIKRVDIALKYLNNRNGLERAKVHLDKALSYNPKLGDVHYGLGIYYNRVKEYKLSQKHYKRALRLEAKNPKFLNAYAAFLCERGEYEQAEQTFDKVIKIPTYAELFNAYYNIGLCALKQEKKQLAKENFLKALNRNKNMSGALIEMSKIEFASKRYSRAKSYLERFETNGVITSESAWLGLRIAHYLRDKDAIAKYGLILEQRFPDSLETSQYLDEKKRWM